MSSSARPVQVETVFGPVTLTHWNLNDETLEGLRCEAVPAFSVQYHPEAAPGPHDAGYLFEEGWSGGHTAWIQVLTRRPRGLQVMVRAFWYQTQSLGPFREDELGAYLSVSAQLREFIALRFSGLGRAGGSPGVQPFSSNGSVLSGTFDIALAGRF